MAWALDQLCNAGGWKLVHAYGSKGGTATYSRINVGPGKWEQVFCGGLLLLRKGNKRVVVNMNLDPTEGAEMVVTAAAGQEEAGQAFARAMKLPEDKVFHNIQRYGNTTAASIPIALDEALEQGILGPGSTVMFLGLGAGLTWGAVLYRFP